MSIKTIWVMIVNAFMAMLGFFAAWAIWGKADKGLSAEEYIKEKAEKAKEKAREEVNATPAADIGPKYLDPASNAGIDAVKKSTFKRIMDRITGGSGSDNPGGNQQGD